MVDKVEKEEKNGTKQNKIFQVVSNILFAVFMIIILFFIFITAQSRFKEWNLLYWDTGYI